MILATPDSDIAPATEGAALISSERLLTAVNGDVSEVAFELEARKRGWIVCTPRGHAQDFDCIVMRPAGAPVVVQVKRASWQRSHYNIRAHRLGGVAYGPAAFDVLASHLPDVDRWVMHTRAELGSRIMTSFTLPEHRQRRIRSSAPASRNPDNWELLDEVAAAKTNSGSRTANV